MWYCSLLRYVYCASWYCDDNKKNDILCSPTQLNTTVKNKNKTVTLTIWKQCASQSWKCLLLSETSDGAIWILVFVNLLLLTTFLIKYLIWHYLLSLLLSHSALMLESKTAHNSLSNIYFILFIIVSLKQPDLFKFFLSKTQFCKITFEHIVMM